MLILAFGGSLREGSFNRSLLTEAALLAPQGTELDLGLLPVIGALPLFNQDVAGRDFPSRPLRAAPPLTDGLRLSPVHTSAGACRASARIGQETRMAANTWRLAEIFAPRCRLREPRT